jgi:hypothetical protein
LNAATAFGGHATTCTAVGTAVTVARTVVRAGALWPPPPHAVASVNSAQSPPTIALRLRMISMLVCRRRSSFP